MDDRERHLNRLKLAEQQFRLACTVHLAVTNGVQVLDVPVEWTFGKHRVSYADFGLRVDQADVAAFYLEMTATFSIACVIRDAISKLFTNPKNDLDQRVVAAYQISRMIRNAFAHSMLYPEWHIDDDCRDKRFCIDQVISLNTTDLDRKPLRWQDYGGPLAIFYLGRFVRETLLGDKIDPSHQKPPYPTVESYQQGRMILRRVDELPDDVLIASVGPGERLELGGGHYIEVPRADDKSHTAE